MRLLQAGKISAKSSSKSIGLTRVSLTCTGSKGFRRGKRGTISVLVYILIGLVGVPVFAGFSGGFSSVVTPSFGYIIGFILTALAVGLSAKFFGNKLVPLIISMIIGLLLCYIVGTIWFMVVYNVTNQYIDLGLALSWCVVPFIIPDMAKIAVAAILVNRLDKIVKL